MIQNKKNLFIIIILIVMGISILFFLLKGTEPYTKNNLSEQEQKFNESEQTYDISLLQGKWRSIDDVNSVIEFNANKKIEYYLSNKMFEGDFDIERNYLTVKDDTEIFEYQIIALSNNTLTLIYLPRGNTLSYKRIQ